MLCAAYIGLTMIDKLIFRLFLTVPTFFIYLIPTAQASWGQNWGTMIWGQSAPSYQVPFMDGMGLIISALVIAVIGLVSMRFGSKRMAAFLVVLLAPITAITVPSLVTFTNGTVADATQVNANFQAINDYLSTNVPASSVIYSLPEGVDTLDVDPSEIESVCNDGDSCNANLCLTMLSHLSGVNYTACNEIHVRTLHTSANEFYGISFFNNGAFVLGQSDGEESNIITANACNYNDGQLKSISGKVAITDCTYSHTPSSSTSFQNAPNPNGWTIIKNPTNGGDTFSATLEFMD